MGGGGGYVPSDGEFETIRDRVRRSIDQSREQEKGRNLFIAFAHEDKNEVDMLRGQARNQDSELHFQDFSVRVPFDSERAEYLRRRIRERIRRCSVAVVYLSEASASSSWVEWEIEEAGRLGKGVVGVHKGDRPPSELPPAFRECGAEIVRWRHQDLMDAIERAVEQRDSE